MNVPISAGECLLIANDDWNDATIWVALWMSYGLRVKVLLDGNGKSAFTFTPNSAQRRVEVTMTGSGGTTLRVARIM